MRFLLTAALLALIVWACGTANAVARPATPDALKSVNNAVATTHYWQAKGGFCCKRYWWVAHRHSTPTWKRWHIAAMWWGNASVAHSRYVREQHTSGVPSWFRSAMSCISEHEEYGYAGGSTSAGYFGFIYPPSSYQAPGPALAAQYGDSWLGIPLSAQLSMAWSLYASYGWSPWTTAAGCGLG